MISGSFENCYQQAIRLQIMYIYAYMYKQDLPLNNR